MNVDTHEPVHKFEVELTSDELQKLVLEAENYPNDSMTYQLIDALLSAGR